MTGSRARQALRLWSARVLLMGLSTLACIALAEVGLRMVRRVDNPPGFTEKHPTRRYQLRAGWTGHTYDARIAINSRAMRGPERAISRSPSAFRVVVLGDSMTYGVGVEQEDTYPALLEQRLRTQGLAAQVFNTGVPSYNTVDQQLYLEELFETHEPHLVLLQYMYANDWTDYPRPRPQTGFRDTWLWQQLRELPTRSYIHYYYWIIHGDLMYRSERSGVPEGPLDRLRAEAEYLLENVYVAEHRGWQRSQAALAKIVRGCQQRGVPLLFMVNLNHIDLSRESRRVLQPAVELFTETLRGMGGEHMLVLDDAFDGYAGREAELKVREHDAHYSVLAHQLIADEIEDYLVAHPALLGRGQGSIALEDEATPAPQEADL